jgi:Pentapeptide repeats (9 copies)
LAAQPSPARPSFFGATFSGEAGFRKATFGKTSRFVNAEIKGETSFERAIFGKEPPHFFGAKLHQGTVWRGIDWPKPKKADEAGAFLDAYACLKLEMDRLKKHEDELDFFALEMRSRRVLLGPLRGLPIALYGVLSDYGRSYARPLVALFIVAAIGAGAFWYFDARTFWEALGLSAANTLNVFGFRRDFNLAIDTPFAWLKVFAALQTILGTILLFLFGLGIRNKFRMK